MYQKPELSAVGTASELIAGVAGNFVESDIVTPGFQSLLSSRLDED
ncbi:MAG: hypothetical protein LAO20_21785 [Acidobacteriia bacterium]|nr:hypothetical protein [Terriglobia bacterium]